MHEIHVQTSDYYCNLKDSLHTRITNKLCTIQTTNLHIPIYARTAIIYTNLYESTYTKRKIINTRVHDTQN